MPVRYTDQSKSATTISFSLAKPENDVAALELNDRSSGNDWVRQTDGVRPVCLRNARANSCWALIPEMVGDFFDRHRPGNWTFTRLASKPTMTMRLPAATRSTVDSMTFVLPVASITIGAPSWCVCSSTCPSSCLFHFYIARGIKQILVS